MPDWLVSLLVAGIISGLGYLGTLAARKKDKADLATQFQAMAKSTAKDLEEEREERRTLENRLDELLTGIRKLIRQLEAANIEPCWHPSDKPARKMEEQG